MIENNGEPWLNAPHVRQFLALYTADLKSTYRRSQYFKQIEEWVEYCCSIKSCDARSLDFSKFTVFEYEGNRYYRPIKRQVVDSFIETRPNPTQKYAADRALWRFFEYLKERGVLKTNPAPKPKAPRPTQHRTTDLIVSEILRFIRHLQTVEMPYRAAISVQLAAGLRVSELCNLRIDDVDHNSNGFTIAVRREALKSRNSHRWLPLPDLTNTLSEYWQWREENGLQSDFYFVDFMGQLNALKLNKVLKRIGEEAGLSQTVTSHMMRRAYATLIKERLTDEEALRRLLGHQKEDFITTFQYISRPELKHIREQMGKLPCFQIAESFAAKWMESNH